MPVTSKVAAAAAALMLAGGVAAAAVPARAATAQCGASCVELSSRVSASYDPFLAPLVLDALDRGQAPGTAIVLSLASHRNAGEDFEASVSTVNQYLQAGLVGLNVAQHYGCVVGAPFPSCPSGDVNDVAFELQYTPDGASTGQCVGVPATAGQGTQVSLQPCGVSAATVWIVDSPASINGSYVPLINGTDTNFSHPYVLTYPATPFLWWLPPGIPQLETATLQENAAGRVPDNQLWREDVGVLR
jgi:hypothetical protein